eukprot:CAMPEP_0117541030 /NCGR_PEP_ID=MMETSP0784-20121206/43806_1 /TAXON_ID=39447 /ORGANISM="" /LENGTH=196 /DNA_ID=CAMNT_0005337707 /DNA_START=301 /DNA_END=891 /DNA_ORIENTATION=+
MQLEGHHGVAQLRQFISRGPVPILFQLEVVQPVRTPHALVTHEKDPALRRGLQEGHDDARQEKRSHDIDSQRMLVALPRGHPHVRIVAIEGSGVVDDSIDAREGGQQLPAKPAHVRHQAEVGHVGLNRRAIGFAPIFPNVLPRNGDPVLVAAVHDYVRAFTRQLFCCLLANTARAACYQVRFAFQVSPASEEKRFL